MGVPAGSTGTSVVEMRSFDPTIIGSIFTRVDMNWSKDAAAKFVVCSMGELSLIRSTHTASKSVSRRLERHMSDEDTEHYFACLPRTGEVNIRFLARDNKRQHECHVPKGQLALVNTRQEYEIFMSDTLDAMWLRIPAHLLKSHAIAVDDALGKPMNVQTGLGLMAKRMMCGAISEGLGASDRGARLFSQSLLSFLGEVVNTSSVSDTNAASRGRRKILERAQEYIEEHIHEDGLNPADIARGVGISSRYLSEIFAAEGTSPMRWVRRRRLELCRMELERPNCGHQLVCEIAYSMGFTNVSSFNRAFKAQFGYAPRELLAQNAAETKRVN